MNSLQKIFITTFFISQIIVTANLEQQTVSNQPTEMYPAQINFTAQDLEQEYINILQSSTNKQELIQKIGVLKLKIQTLFNTISFIPKIMQSIIVTLGGLIIMSESDKVKFNNRDSEACIKQILNKINNTRLSLELTENIEKFQKERAIDNKYVQENYLCTNNAVEHHQCNSTCYYEKLQKHIQQELQKSELPYYIGAASCLGVVSYLTYSIITNCNELLQLKKLLEKIEQLEQVLLYTNI